MGVARRESSGVQIFFWRALESFVLSLSTTYLKTKRAAGFAEECYFIEVRPLTIIVLVKTSAKDRQRSGRMYYIIVVNAKICFVHVNNE